VTKTTFIAAGISFAAAAAAGPFGLGLGVSLYTPPEEGVSWTPLFSANAHYWVTKNWVGALSVGYARYGIDDTTYNYLPIIPRAIYHFRPGKAADPYAGVGFVYARRWWDGPEDGSKNTYGFSTLVGANFALGEHFGFGLGVEYVFPDAGDFDYHYPSFVLSFGAGSM